VEDLKDRVAVVTGGTKGIGKAIALRLVRAGAAVAVTYGHDDDVARQTTDQLTRHGEAAVMAVKSDATQAEAVSGLRAEVEDRLGPVGILVNNVGSVLRPGHWLDQSLTELDRTLRLNLMSAMLATRQFAPGMRERSWGRIVNISSTVAMVSGAPVAAYGAAKAGLLSYTQAMARELAASGVLVNAVAPGTIDTGLTRAAPDAVTARSIAATPLGRLGAPDEVAEAVEFLLRSTFVVGHVLVVDGGQLLNV